MWEGFAVSESFIEANNVQFIQTAVKDWSLEKWCDEMLFKFQCKLGTPFSGLADTPTRTWIEEISITGLEKNETVLIYFKVSYTFKYSKNITLNEDI